MDNARDLELMAIQGIMATKDGRKFMARFLKRTYVNDDTFDNDPYSHAHRAGLRSAGLWLIRELKQAGHGSYLTMLKEEEDG